MVAVCMVAALVGNALGLFGAGVYLHVLIETKRWPAGALSGAVTLFYVVSALLLIPVGTAISRFGPRLVIASGALAMSIGTGAIGRAHEIWQVYAAFLVMGLGWACLSTTAVATTLAPWFDKHQGRAVSIASLGASAGGMFGVPVLLFGIGRIGLAATTSTAALTAFTVLSPLAWFVLKHRPGDIGLLPDGVPGGVLGGVGGHIATATAVERRWTRTAAMRTLALRSVVLTFGIGMMVQIGFLTHQVTLLSPVLGWAGTSATVSATAVSALIGRLALVRYADRIPQRTTATFVLLLAAGALVLLALPVPPPVLIGASILFGVSVGNVTTLAPIIVRREFGAASFGVIFGVASALIQLAAALGPGLFGLLHDAFDGYRVPLLLAASADVAAGAIISSGGPQRDRSLVWTR
jgi:MFS family permease